MQAAAIGWRWPALLLTWAAFGAASSMVLTPPGRLIRRCAPPEERTSAFAAQFSPSRSCWLLTYPLAGWLGSMAGLQSAVAALGAITLAAGLLAMRLWPSKEGTAVEHEHIDLHQTHLGAVRVEGGWRHSHRLLADGLHAHR
ncbi:MFS transporter [Streptomyces sp. NPDC004227]